MELCRTARSAKNAASQSRFSSSERILAFWSSALNVMNTRRLRKWLIGAVAAALCVYGGLYVYKGQKYAGAFADSRLGDSPEVVRHRFGVPPNVEFPHSGYFMGFTMFPCAQPCDQRLWWSDPSSVFRQRAFYFEFDATQSLIRKTSYEHLDESYVKWMERMKHAPKVDMFATEAEKFHAAKVVVLVRLLEPPQVDPRDPSLGQLSKFLVVRSWKGLFAQGGTMIAATNVWCFGPSCKPNPTEVGHSAVIYSLGDVQPVYPFLVDGRDVDKQAVELDKLAAQSGK